MIRNDSLIGHRLDDRYDLQQVIGEGATGTVYLAEHVRLGCLRAIKVLKRELTTDAELVERFHIEARAVSRLGHPNLVDLHDFGQTADGRLFLVLEYVGGLGLRDLLEAQDPPVLPVDRALSLLAQIARGLAAAHDAGIVHRDLKPENLRVAPDRTGADRVKILDFGLAKILGDPYDTLRGTILGTWPYMAPEQILQEPVDHRTDLYALGVVAFEILAGQLPFRCQSAIEYANAHLTREPPWLPDARPAGASPLPAGLPELVAQCLEKAPADRPGNAQFVSHLLEQCREELRHAGTEAGDVAYLQTLRRSVIGLPAGLDTLDSPAGGPDRAEGERARERLMRQAKSLAQTLRTRGARGEAIGRALDEVVQAEEAVIARGADRALIEARLAELDLALRDREAQLRFAVIDRRIALDGLRGDTQPSAEGLVDLLYQIETLGDRLEDLARERAEGEAELLAQVAALEPTLLADAQREVEADARLVAALVASRGQLTDPVLLDRMFELERWLRDSAHGGPSGVEFR